MTNFNLSDFLRLLGTFSATPTSEDDTVSNESAEPTETSNATSNTTTTETSNTTTNATSNTTPTGLAPDSLSSVEYQDDISGSQRSSCNIEHLISDINETGVLTHNCPSDKLENLESCYVYCKGINLNVQEKSTLGEYLREKRVGKISCGQITEQQLRNCNEGDTNCPNSHNIEEITCEVDGQQRLFDIDLNTFDIDDGFITSSFIVTASATTMLYLIFL